MDNKLHNTIQELGRSIQSAQEDAKRKCTSSNVSPQNLFQSELNYKMQQYVHDMHSYLNIDRVLGFPIQPMSYSSETRVSDRGVSVRLAIHHYPPVKPMIIEAPEMVLELRATVDSSGRMEYQFSNYFANPTDLEALAKHLPEGTCIILQEDSSLAVQSLNESGTKFSGGSFSPNYPIDNVDVTSNGNDFFEKTGNSLNGVGFTVAGMECSASRALSRTLAYTSTNTVVKASKVMFKMPVGSVYVSTKFVGGATKILRVGGRVVGGVGVLMTGYEIVTNQKDFIGEGGLDLIMGGVAFVPGGGWIVSGVYFGGKLLLESTGNDFWNE